MLQINNALQSGRSGSSLKILKLKAPVQRLRKNGEGVSKQISRHADTMTFVETNVVLILVNKVVDHLSHDASPDPLAAKLTWLSNVHAHLVSPTTA